MITGTVEDTRRDFLRVGGLVSSILVVGHRMGFLETLAQASEPVMLFPLKIGQKYGYIGKDGQIVLPPTFDHADAFSDGLAAVKVGNRWGYIDGKGKMAIEPTYDLADAFSDGLAAVASDQRWGFVDKTALRIRAVLPHVNPFHEGLACVYTGRGWAYIDKQGTPILFLEDDSFRVKNHTSPENTFNLFALPGIQTVRAKSFSEGLAAMDLKEKGPRNWGFVDASGRTVISPRFEGAEGFREGLAVVHLGDKFGYTDKQGRLAIPPSFDFASDFHEGRAWVRVKDRYGYIDKTGAVKTLLFADASFFVRDYHEGFAVNKLSDTKYGYIDLIGKQIIPAIFEDAEDFSLGLARVTLSGQQGYIDRTGKFVWDPKRST